MNSKSSLIIEGLRKSRKDESVYESLNEGKSTKIDNLIKGMERNIKGVETFIEKGQPIGITIKTTLDMCKGVDKEIGTSLFGYYKKELNGLKDNSSGIEDRLLDVMRGVLDELYKAKRETLESSIGTEIGLPIDKENCEGTDISNISTPDGKVGNITVKKEKEYICPSCKSNNVIIKDGKFHCTGCENEWGINEIKEKGKSTEIRKKIELKESIKYAVGKKFTSKDMDFEVKKINKDGTINIWVEQDKKFYDVEVSDLELLHPKEVKG